LNDTKRSLGPSVVLNFFLNGVDLGGYIAFFDSPGPNQGNRLYIGASRIQVVQNFTAWIEGDLLCDRSVGRPLRPARRPVQRRRHRRLQSGRFGRRRLVLGFYRRDHGWPGLARRDQRASALTPVIALAQNCIRSR